MNVGSQSHVIGVGKIVGRNAPVKIVKPETVWASSRQPINMIAAYAAVETTVLPRMIDMVVRVIGTGIMSDPLVISMNVRRFGMPRRVAKVAGC